MTDEQLDRMIDANREHLKIALRDLLSGRGSHIYTFAEGVDSETGIRSKITCILAHELTAVILEGTLQGMAKSEQLYKDMVAKAQEGRIIQ